MLFVYTVSKLLESHSKSFRLLTKGGKYPGSQDPFRTTFTELRSNKMSWTCVDDRLPDTSDDVLAYSPEDGCYRAWCDNNVWFSHENTSSNQPTHWMRMPAEPMNQVPNPSGCYGMTDKLVSSDTRPYSVWSETMDTAKDIKDAWELPPSKSTRSFINKRNSEKSFFSRRG